MADAMYTHEKLEATLHVLVEGKGRIKERLEDAYVSQGSRTPALDGGTHDPALAEDIRQWHEDMTSVPAEAGEGTIAATVERMSEDDAQAMAQRIGELAARVADLYWITERGAEE